MYMYLYTRTLIWWKINKLLQLVIVGGGPGILPGARSCDRHSDFRFHDSSLFPSPSLLLSPLFSLPSSSLSLFLFYSFRLHYENSASVAAKPMSLRFYISRPFSLLSSANTTKTAPVSPLSWCHCDFRFDDSSLSRRRKGGRLLLKSPSLRSRF